LNEVEKSDGEVRYKGFSSRLLTFFRKRKFVDAHPSCSGIRCSQPSRFRHLQMGPADGLKLRKKHDVEEELLFFSSLSA
jgi:hypothetical protein